MNPEEAIEGAKLFPEAKLALLVFTTLLLAYRIVRLRGLLGPAAAPLSGRLRVYLYMGGMGHLLALLLLHAGVIGVVVSHAPLLAFIAVYPLGAGGLFEQTVRETWWLHEAVGVWAGLALTVSAVWFTLLVRRLSPFTLHVAATAVTGLLLHHGLAPSIVHVGLGYTLLVHLLLPRGLHWLYTVAGAARNPFKLPAWAKLQ